MKYGELPSALTCHKLINVSFSTAKKNLAVFRFTRAIRGYQEYIENERNKLLEQCCHPVPGKPGAFELTDIFREKLFEMLELEIAEELPPIGITEKDFEDENCKYPEDKNLWMNAWDIETILKLVKEGDKV